MPSARRQRAKSCACMRALRCWAFGTLVCLASAVSAVPALQKEGARVLAGTSQRCDDETYEGDLFAQRVLQRPTNRLLVKTEGSATSNVAEIQELQLWSHQVIDVTVSGAQLTGGTFALEFCTFDVQLPGTVDLAPIPGDGSDDLILVTVDDDEDVATSWENFGVYSGYPIRISTDETTETQDRAVYRIYYTECDNCDGDVMQLDRDYQGTTIRRGGGAVWGCSWDLPQTQLPYAAGTSAMEAAFENALGSGAVESVTRTAIDENLGQGFIYRVTLAKGVVGVHARVDSSNLRGESISVNATEVVRGAEEDATFASETERTDLEGSYTLGFDGEDTTSLGVTSSALQVKNALADLPGIGPNVAVTKGSDGWTWQVTFNDEAGDIADLATTILSDSTPGLTLKVETVRVGLATLDGEFELVLASTNASITVSATETDTNMRSLLRSGLGLSDVSVKRTGPSESNGFEWEIGLTGDCPDEFDPDDDELYITPTCDVEVMPGPRTASLLLGNDATLTVTNLVAVDLAGTWGGESVSWREVSRTPTSLPASTTSNGHYYLPVESNQRGRYAFEAVSSSDSSTVVGTELVFVDAASPNASVGEALAVSYPTDWIEITGNASSARFGSSIASYAWTLKSKPASASASAGQIRYPTAKTTTVSNLNVPGTFQYQLRVTDSLGLTSCALKSVNVLFAPSIDQPLQDQDIVPGNDLVLNCTASGSTPLSYTWNFKDVTLDVPSTTSVLVLPEVTETDQGNYSCSVTNEVSTIQSNSVWVNVYNPVEIVSSPSPTVAAPGSSATLSCAATATFPVNVTWQRRDFGDTTWSTYSTQRGISGTEDVASSFTLTLTQTSEDNEGEYRCVVANIVGNASSASAMLDILDLPSNVSLTVEPESVLVDGIDEDGKGSFRLSCSALGQNLSFAFARSGAIIANQVDSLYVSNVTAAKDAGEYTCVVTNGAGSVSSEGLEIVVNTPPIIVEQPTSLVVQPGVNVTLDVQATGARPLEYLWKKDGQFIREERSALRNLTFTSVAESDQGSYSVVVYNHLGHAESVSVTLDVDDPPQIVSPLGETTVRVDPGETAQLRCVANGTGTLSFMWYEVLNATANTLTRVVRGRETSGANWTELALYSVTNDDDRAYHCLATSDLGEALSPAIILDVNDPPSITLDPLDTFAEPGATVILQVEASGAEPISFQWRKDGAPISGATARIIILRNVSAADEGSYDCRATNHLSPVTGALSEVGALRLARAPEIVTAPQQETYVDPTSTATLSCAFSGAPPMTYKWLYRSAGADDLILQQNETDEAYVESVFTIPSAVESDQGTYVLLAENRLGNVTSSAAELYINDPPVITSERVRKLVDPGANVSFTCAVTADPAVESVTWKRRPTSGSSGDVVLSGQTSLTIEIAAAQQENEGQYVCLAVNSAGSAEKVVGILDVRDPPTIVRMEPVAEGGILTVDPLQSVTLSAVATGLEPLSYNWTLNGEVAQMGTGSNFTFVPSEAGYVDVRVTNQLGFDVSTPIQIAINAPAQVDSVTISPANGRIIPGGSAELLCRGSGSTPLSFSWLKDGDLVESTVDPVGADATVNASEVPRFVIRESDDYSSLLQVLDADVATHSGSYSCRVRNSALPAGIISSPLDLEVVVAPLLRATKPEDITRLPGTNSTFQCETVAGTGPFEIRWFYTETLGVAAEEIAMWNSSLFEAAIGTYQPNASTHELILIIPNASDDDEGLYSCEVCNEGGCAQSRWANLGVSDAPRIVEQIPSGEDASIVANPGEMVTLSVEASGLEPLGFQWYKYDNSTDAMVLVEVDGDAYHLEPESCSEAGVPCKLVMDEVSNDQAGSYHCVVSNSLGMTSSVLVSLSVTVRPSLADETTWPSSLVTACPGNEFEQEVELVGTRPMLIEWYFSATFAGTTSIFTTEPVWQTTEAVFRISDPEYSNEGYYAFIATNVAGTLRSEIARLEVNEGPSAAADATGASPRHPVTLPQTFTRLYGTASKNAVSYTWELLSSPDLGTGRVQLLTPLAASTDVLGLTIPGAYVFQLTVVGSNGCYSTDTVSVTVNTAPIPVVFDATISLGNSPAELDASNSYDADAGGSIISFNWNVAALDGSVELAKDVALTGNDTAIVSLSYPAVGLYELVLTVTDNDGATSSQRVTLNVLDIKFLSPSSPFAAPFILGSCFEHLIVVDIEGTLPDGDDTTFRLAFTTSNETTTAESPTLVSSQLRSLEGASMTSAGAQVVYMWSVGHRVMAGTGYLEVVVGTNARTRTSSEMFEIILPYRFAITDEGDCDCAATPSRSQTIRCIGFGQDSSASGESCAWYEVEHDDALCEKYAPMPARNVSCSAADLDACSVSTTHWQTGAWTQSPGLDKSTFCSAQPCETVRSRTVQCVDEAGEETSDSACSGVAPLASETCIAEEDSCFVGELRRLGGQSIEAEADDETCVAAIYRETPTLCFDTVSGYLLSEDDCASSSLPSVDESLACSSIWFADAWSCDRATNLAWRNVTCVDSVTFASSESCDVDSRPPSGAACVGTNRILEDDEQLISNEGWFRWRLGTWGECLLVSESLGPSICPMTQRSREVFCVNRQGEITSEARCAGIEKPRSIETCKSECLTSCEATCGVHGRCKDGSTLSCTCDHGWTGETCSISSKEAKSCNGENQVLTENGECCDLSVATLSNTGECCASGVVDRKGACCASGELDICGECDGTGKSIDLQGECCDSVLDAEGSCCSSGLLDRCGVCDGTGHSCVARATLEGSLGLAGDDNVTFWSDAQKHLIASQVLANVLNASLPAASSWTLLGLQVIQTQERRVLGTRNTIEDNSLEVVADVEMYASSELQWPTIDNASSWSELSASAFNVSGADVVAAGVCGNGICEIGERCTRPGCCPSDCVAPDALVRCPSDCSSHGRCLTDRGKCDCYPGYGGEDCSSCTGSSRLSAQGQCIPLSWVPVAASDAMGAWGNDDETNATIVTVVRKVQVFWPGFLLGLFLLCASLACVGAWFRCRERRLRKEAELRRRRRQVFADPTDDDDDEFLSEKEIKPTLRPRESPEARSLGKGRPRGWLWKRSRNGFDGQQVWQQWYASKHDSELYYYDCDLGEAWSEAGGSGPIERGRLSLDRVEAVMVKGKKSAKYGGWRFDLVLRAFSSVKRADEEENGLRRDVSDDEDDDGENGSLARETVDVLDFPQVKSRDMKESAAKADARIRIEFMCESRHDAHTWAEAIAKTSGARLRIGRGGGLGSGLKPTNEERVKIDLWSVASSSIASAQSGPSVTDPASPCSSRSNVSGASVATSVPGMIQEAGEAFTAAGSSEDKSHVSSYPSLVTSSQSGSLSPGTSSRSSGTSVSGIEGLMVGSFSGAVGDRVACEGWIRLEKEKRSVYGVLFPQRDELAVFGRMMPAQDGAHHYADKLHSVSLAHVVSVSEMGLSNSIELIFWDGKRFSFVASSQAKDMWRSTLRRHMKFVHGVNAEATKPPGAERPPRITEESRPESEDVAESPHTPAPKDLYAVNEPLSSLRVRRSSSVSAGRAGTTAHVSGCREEVEAATSSISVKKNPRDCTPPLRPAPTTAARTRGSKLGPALGSHTRDIENKNNSSNKNRFTTTTNNNSRGGGDRDIAHNDDVDDDEAAAALIDMQVV